MAFVAEQLRALGADVTIVPQTTAGNQIQALWPGADPSTQFLTLCHLDTVWPSGTLAKMPLREADGKLYGPGVYDMKAGTAILLTALRVLREAGPAAQTSRADAVHQR